MKKQKGCPAAFHPDGSFVSAGLSAHPLLKACGLGDFPGGAVVKSLPANAGDTGSIPGPGRSHMLQSN